MGDGEGGSVGLSRDLTKMKENSKRFESGKGFESGKKFVSGKEFVSDKKLALGNNVCEVKISPSSSCV